MKLRYIVLGKKRNNIREIARKHFLLNRTNTEKAIEGATEELKTKGIITSILIGLAIKLAVELIIYWIKNNVLIPSENYQAGEPGNE